MLRWCGVELKSLLIPAHSSPCCLREFAEPKCSEQSISAWVQAFGEDGNLGRSAHPRLHSTSTKHGLLEQGIGVILSQAKRTTVSPLTSATSGSSGTSPLLAFPHLRNCDMNSASPCRIFASDNRLGRLRILKPENQSCTPECPDTDTR